MEIVLVVFAVMLLPLAALAALLGFAARAARDRSAVVARQIALTDAIHRDLGPVVSPWVTRRGDRWRVSVAIPFDRPALVEGVVGIARRAFPDRLELVLTPKEGGRP